MYKITLSYDGNSVRWSGDYDDALEAFTAFAKFTDVGFANEYTTINLSEPSGKMHTKILYRSGIVGGK